MSSENEDLKTNIKKMAALFLTVPRKYNFYQSNQP